MTAKEYIENTIPTAMMHYEVKRINGNGSPECLDDLIERFREIAINTKLLLEQEIKTKYKNLKP